MGTLTETAYYTRRTINWIILAFIAYLVLRVVWSVGVNAYLALFPPKPVPPNHAFGILPKLGLPQQTDVPQLTYSLETIEGDLPSASGSARVYLMPKKPANLLALNEAEEFADRLSFEPAAIQETKNIYRFNDGEFPLRTLRYDIVSENFIVRYALESDTSILNERELPTEQSAVNEARALLRTYDLAPTDMQNGKAAVTFLRLQGSALTETTSLSQADAVRVDFFRNAIEGTPVVYPTPREGPVSFIFSGSKSGKKHILQFAYTYWPIDYTAVATYELKPPATAWQELQENKGFIASLPATGTSVIVRDVYLAYLDTYEPQTYMQPVFVFEGDNGFVGYVSAVSTEWTEQ